MPRADKGLQPPFPGDSSQEADEAYVHRLKAILREARLAQGLNFRQLEERSGLSFGYLANSERSDNQPTVLTFRRWCRALGLRFEEVCQQAAKPE